MTIRKIPTEDRVLIASPDWSKWETDHAEEITEEIDEAGISATAFDCGTGRDCGINTRNVFLRLFQCKLTDCMSLRIPQAGCLSQYSKWASLSFEVKDYDISGTYFLGTSEKLIHI